MRQDVCLEHDEEVTCRGGEEAATLSSSLCLRSRGEGEAATLCGRVVLERGGEGRWQPRFVAPLRMT